MALEEILQTESLSETEEHIIAEVLQTPALRKYLRIMGKNDTEELLSLSAVANDDMAIVKAHCVVQGKLQVIATLLSIEAPQPQPNQEEQ